MSSDNVRAITRNIANLISNGQYTNAIQACSSSRLSEADIASVIKDYGRTFIRTPTDFSEYIDLAVVKGCSVSTWSIRAPLWTREEGRSDLTLELTIAVSPSGTDVELDDLRVL